MLPGGARRAAAQAEEQGLGASAHARREVEHDEVDEQDDGEDGARDAGRVVGVQGVEAQNDQAQDRGDGHLDQEVLQQLGHVQQVVEQQHGQEGQQQPLLRLCLAEEVRLGPAPPKTSDA